MSTADEIHIASLELSACVGVPDEERARPQRLTVSLTLRAASGFSDLDERLKRTIDYAAVCASVQDLARARPRRLIETLAEEIALGVLAGFAQCVSVDVELRKYILPDTDYVAVRLSRSQAVNRAEI
jgi:dihydroneopterin aldolase